jgi:RHS repeat-associated protein
MYTFTGQASYMDDPTTTTTVGGFGLIFYQSRFYDPALGRFTSPDTLIPESQGVQAWDRYAFVNNNPLRYTDPSGHRNCEEDGYNCDKDERDDEQPTDVTKWLALELDAQREFIHSPYAERPEGSRKLGLLIIQTFGTVRNISYSKILQ